MQKNTYKFGYTLVEVLLVILVIGILSTIFIVSYNGLTKKAVQSSIQSDLESSVGLLENYRIKHNNLFPIDIDDVDIKLSSGNNIDLYNQTGNSFCLQISNERIIYHIEYETMVPERGKCPLYTLAMSFDAENGHYASDVIQTMTAGAYDGGFVVTGGTSDPKSDMYIAKYDEYGNQVWLTEWKGDGKGNDWGRSVIQDGNNLVVAGETFNGNDYDVLIAKFDFDTGALLDDAISSDMEYEDDNTYPYSLIKTHDGYAVTGKSARGNNYYQAFIAKLDSNGHNYEENYWYYPHESPDKNSYNTSIIETYEYNEEDSTYHYYYVVAGAMDTEEDSWDWFIGKYEASNGDQIWRDTDWDRWGNPNVSGNNSYSEHVVQIGDGHYMMVGTNDNNSWGNVDPFVFKFQQNLDEEGEIQLLEHYSVSGSHFDWITSLIPISNGGYAFAGGYGCDDENGDFNNYNALIIEGQEDGKIAVWKDGDGENMEAMKTFGYEDTDELSFSIVQLANGNLRILGESNGYDETRNFRPFLVEYVGSDNGGTSEEINFKWLPED